MFKGLLKRSVAPATRPVWSRRGIRDSAVETARRLRGLIDLRDTLGTRGFTLLELLIVLFVMALIAAVGAPNLGRLYASIQRQTERDYILDQFAGLGRMALRHGQSYVIAVTGPSGPDSEDSSELPTLRLREARAEPYIIDLPEGWTIDLSRPLVIGANGVCLGAELTLLHNGKVETRLSLEPPYCRIPTHG